MTHKFNGLLLVWYMIVSRLARIRCLTRNRWPTHPLRSKNRYHLEIWRRNNTGNSIALLKTFMICVRSPECNKMTVDSVLFCDRKPTTMSTWRVISELVTSLWIHKNNERHGFLPCFWSHSFLQVALLSTSRRHRFYYSDVDTMHHVSYPLPPPKKQLWMEPRLFDRCPALGSGISTQSRLGTHIGPKRSLVST